jgi:hypothetical protein
MKIIKLTYLDRFKQFFRTPKRVLIEKTNTNLIIETHRYKDKKTIKVYGN